MTATLSKLEMNSLPAAEDRSMSQAPIAATSEVPNKTTSSKSTPTVKPLRAWLNKLAGFAVQLLPQVLGIALLVLIWSIIAEKNSALPTPTATYQEALKVFADPFYQNGPNDQGIGWNIYASLKRVALGFGLAAMIGIPLGFMIGRFQFLAGMFNPIISLLKPVSPLAWLPIGLLVFKAAHPAAIWSIFICSIWPMIINTSIGVQRVPQDYLNVARVLNLQNGRSLPAFYSPAYCLTCSLVSAWRSAQHG